MTLTITRQVYDQLLAAARRHAPLEACGLCGGRDGLVSCFIELTNADAAADHYTMIPAEQFAAVRTFRAAQLQLLAIWHSHPASPARLSAEDLRLAYDPNLVYLVLSLEKPAEPALKGFTVTDGQSAAVNLLLR